MGDKGQIEEISEDSSRDCVKHLNGDLNKQNTYLIITWQLLALFGLNIAYFSITKAFDYYGYFLFDFDLTKFIIGSTVLLISLIIGVTVKKPFYSTVWNIFFIYYLGGEVIYYQYNPGANSYQIISIFSLLVFIALISRLNKRFKSIRIKNTKQIVSITAFLLFIPFFIIYFKHINLKNLLLIDVYETRGAVSGNMFTSYLMAPLSRVILPILIVSNLFKKKYAMVLIFSVMILFLYLTSALKSILIGLIAIFIFYSGSYYKKTLLFLKGVSFITIIGSLLYLLFGKVILIDALVRRVFFVPAHLGNVYYDIFKDNLTYLSHSPFGLGIVDYPYANQNIIKYVGELTGISASHNVGVLTEGIFSFGLIGGIFAAFIISVVIWIINAINLNKRYFGLVFVYIYYLNTSILSTLLLTHGLFFFLVFSYLFVTKNKVNMRV